MSQFSLVVSQPKFDLLSPAIVTARSRHSGFHPNLQGLHAIQYNNMAEEPERLIMLLLTPPGTILRQFHPPATYDLPLLEQP
jgi:hypothetical protein